MKHLAISDLLPKNYILFFYKEYNFFGNDFKFKGKKYYSYSMVIFVP